MLLFYLESQSHLFFSKICISAARISCKISQKEFSKHCKQMYKTIRIWLIVSKQILSDGVFLLVGKLALYIWNKNNLEICQYFTCLPHSTYIQFTYCVKIYSLYNCIFNLYSCTCWFLAWILTFLRFTAFIFINTKSNNF